MKHLNWDTGNLPRRTKMSHRLRSMLKRRDRELFKRYKSLGLDRSELVIVPHMSQVRANREYIEKRIDHAEELRKRGEVDFFDLICEEGGAR